MSGLLVILLHAVAMPVLAGVLLARWLRCDDKDAAAVVAYSSGFWIALTALLTDLAMRAAPGLPRMAYVAVYTLLCLAVVGVLLRRDPGGDTGTAGFARHIAVRVRQALSGLDPLSLALLLLFGGLCLFSIVSSIVQPLIQNDPITHTIIARHLAEDRSAAAYPFAQADPASGYLIEAVHPLGFPASKALVMLLLGDLDTPWHKPLSAFFLAYLAIGTGVLAWRLFGRRAGVYAFGFCVLTPLIYHSATVAHIDPLRVYGYFAGFAALAEYARNPSRYWTVLGALGLTVCLHAHAGNIIAPALMAPIFLLAAPGSLWARVKTGASVCLPALVLTAPQYLQNYALYGSIAGTSYALERESPEKFQIWYELSRDIASPADAVLYGALSPFTDVANFGFVFWLAIAGSLILIARRGIRERGAAVVLGGLLGYAALVAFAVLTGRIEFYMNARYMLVALPFAAILAGYAVSSLRDFAVARFRPYGGALYLDSLFSRIGSFPLQLVSAVIAIIALLHLSEAGSWAGSKLWQSLSRTFAALTAVLSPSDTATAHDWMRLAVFLGSLGAAFVLWGSRATLASLPPVQHLKRAFSGLSLPARGVTVEILALGLIVLVLTDPIRDLTGRIAQTWYRQPYIESAYVLGSDLTKAKAAMVRNEPSVDLIEPALALRDLKAGERVSSGRTLALRDTEVYLYGSGYTYSAYDRRVWPAYRAISTQDAFDRLKALGISTLYVPNYTVPAVDGTPVEDVINDPRYRKIRFDGERGAPALYDLLEKPREMDIQPMFEAAYPDPAQAPGAQKDTRRNVLTDTGSCSGKTGAPPAQASAATLGPGTTVICEDAGKLGPWLSLPPGAADEEFLIEAETTSVGCLNIVAYQRVQDPSVSRGVRYPVRVFKHYSLTAPHRLMLGVLRREHADAISIHIGSTCLKPAQLRSVKLLRISGVK